MDVWGCLSMAPITVMTYPSVLCTRDSGSLQWDKCHPYPLLYTYIQPLLFVGASQQDNSSFLNIKTAFPFSIFILKAVVGASDTYFKKYLYPRSIISQARRAHACDVMVPLLDRARIKELFVSDMSLKMRRG